ISVFALLLMLVKHSRNDCQLLKLISQCLKIGGNASMVCSILRTSQQCACMKKVRSLGLILNFYIGLLCAIGNVVMLFTLLNLLSGLIELSEKQKVFAKGYPGSSGFAKASPDGPGDGDRPDPFAF